MKKEYVNKIISFAKHHPWITVGVVSFCLLMLLAIISAMNAAVVTETKKPNQTGNTLSLTPTIQPQQAFEVTSTSPKKDATDVYPGELQITANTTTPIVSANSFFLDISPKLPNYWRLSTEFPTNSISATVYGGLQKNTKYTVTLRGKNNYTYSWSFTTSDVQPESSSNLVRDDEEIYMQKNYPLIAYMPYTANDFTMDYSGEHSLIVNMTNGTVSQDQIQQEVEDWMRNKGVDPSTHTIKYVSSYTDY